ncbi:MAG: ATP-grasp fold amidoligase family protein [Candidatus Dormibacteria bacterium]
MVTVPPVLDRLRAWTARELLALTSLGPLAFERQARYLVTQRKVGHFRNPVTFSEKVNWRILNDRRAVLVDTCDKLRAKERAARLGIAVPETIWFGTDVSELSGVNLPERWVLKPNHGSGYVYFGNGAVTDVAHLRAATRGWMRTSLASRSGEWAYLHARPALVVEERLGQDDEAPPDYKFFMFDGKPAAIFVEVDRISNWCRRIYTPDWSPLTVRLGLAGKIRPLAPVVPEPPTLPAMLDAASVLARDFDFVRVDLYSEHGQVYFGELTPYPAGGLARFWPRKFDLELGRHWNLPRLDDSGEELRDDRG